MTWLLSASLLLLGLSGLLRLIETGWFRRTYQDARARLRRAPRGLVVVFSLLLAWAIAFGGGKPSGPSSTPPVPPATEVTPLLVDDDLVVIPEGQAPVQLEVPEDTDAAPVDVPSWPTEVPASNLLAAASPPLAPDTMLSSSSNLARRDFPETPFVTPAGLPRWPFDAFTSNAIAGMAAATQPPIPDVMLATGLALHRVATNQTILTDDGAVSVHDWTRHGADNRAVWVATLFPVVIGTSNYARVGILSNGRLAFGYGTYHRRTSTGLPIGTPYPVVTVAPLWGPFALLPTTSRVWARSEGTDAFVIAWEAMLLGGNETHPATAQCVIKRDGTFRFLYGPQPLGAGNLTTVGAQNQGFGWCYSNSHSNRVQEAMALSLRPAALDGWAYADPDGDSISNYEEFMLGTDPALADSDGDGPSDRWELEHGFDPTVAQLTDPVVDTDGDLIPDGWEAWLGSDPNNPFSGPAFVKDNDLDGFANVYEAALFDYPWDSGPQAPEPVDEDHVDVIAVVDSTRPCVLTITGPDQWIDIPWVPGVSHENVRLRLKRGAQYQVVLSRGPAGSGLSTNGFWWANVHFEAPPEFWGLNGPETVVDDVLSYNAHTVQIETPFRPAYDIWLVPGTTGLPVFDLAAIRLLIDGPLVFCHNTSYAEIALTADSLVTGPVDWTGLPPVTPAQANPLVFDPSTVTPGAYTVVATAAHNPWAWAECQVEIHSLAFAESVIWLSASDTTTHTIALAPGSFPTSGLDVWSEPAGIDSLNITPSELEPGSYTVYAWGACGGAEVVVNVVGAEIQINDTPDDDDDVVCRYSTVPPGRPTVPCRVRILGLLSTDVPVVLSGSSVRFSGETNTTKTLSLPRDGTWVSFCISGQVESNTKDGATLQASMLTPSGPICGIEDLTVLWARNVVLRDTQDAEFATDNASDLKPNPARLGNQQLIPPPTIPTIAHVIEIRADIFPYNFVSIVEFTRDNIDEFIAMQLPPGTPQVIVNNMQIPRGSGSGNDPADPGLHDEEPLPNGRIYDIDTPGHQTGDGAPGNNNLQGTLTFIRMNFLQYAMFDGVRCSDDFAWHVRLTSRKESPPGTGTYVHHTREDHPADNSAGTGSTTMSID